VILLGVTGSIAAYKAVEILRLLVSRGEDVHVMMTPAATRFVGALTFRALSGHPVVTDVLDPKEWQMAHLDAVEHAQAVLIAPASAEALSSFARGGAHDPVSASLLGVPRTKSGSLTKPVFLAPAMHAAMWRHPATQANVATLKSYGYQFIGPVNGVLGRVGDTGEGRMEDPEKIVARVKKTYARTKKL